MRGEGNACSQNLNHQKRILAFALRQATTMQILEPETDRLVLRQWRQSDKAPFYELNADPSVMAYFPDLLSSQQSDAMADRCASLIAGRGWGFWAVELKTSGSFLGFVGLHVPTDRLPFSPCVEIGWRLAYEHWGNGYATEAAREVLRVGFEVIGLQEIVSFTAVVNQRSQAVMRRLGMEEDGTFEHPAVSAASELKRHCLYRIRECPLPMASNRPGSVGVAELCLPFQNPPTTEGKP